MLAIEGFVEGCLFLNCQTYISPENGGFDVRWVRFPKHILLSCFLPGVV